MAAKIILDAGHGGSDPGAVYNGRKEKDDNLALTLAVGDILNNLGYDVEYTRTTDVYDSPIAKARIANDTNSDYFVSIHRNSSPNDNQYNGVQTLVYDDSGIKATMARNVNSELEKLGFRNINVSERPNLTVLRRTKMPAILIEAGFINSDLDNALFDEKFDEIAMAIATGIDETLTQPAISYNSPGEATDKKYQLLAGVYRGFSTASANMSRLIAEGYEADIVEDEGLFQLRVGNFDNIDDTYTTQDKMKDKGYSTLIVKAK